MQNSGGELAPKHAQASADSPFLKPPKVEAQPYHPESPLSAEMKKRYKRCCLKCKHTEKGRRSCVCVVPLGQRRTQIGTQGCQTCGCLGCSIEDYVNRGEDPEYKPSVKKQSDGFDFEARNGCCKSCMKAFSKYNKSCLCQVPKEVRKGELPSSGCKICHCHGCHPEDRRDNEDSYDQHSRPRNRRYTGEESESNSEGIDEGDQNLKNMEKSLIGQMITESGLYAPMLGLGIPQRSYSYIIGRQQPK